MGAACCNANKIATSDVGGGVATKTTKEASVVSTSSATATAEQTEKQAETNGGGGAGGTSAKGQSSRRGSRRQTRDGFTSMFSGEANGQSSLAEKAVPTANAADDTSSTKKRSRRSSKKGSISSKPTADGEMPRHDGDHDDDVDNTPFTGDDSGGLPRNIDAANKQGRRRSNHHDSTTKKSAAAAVPGDEKNNRNYNSSMETEPNDAAPAGDTPLQPNPLTPPSEADDNDRNDTPVKQRSVRSLGEKRKSTTVDMVSPGAATTATTIANESGQQPSTKDKMTRIRLWVDEVAQSGAPVEIPENSIHSNNGDSSHASSHSGTLHNSMSITDNGQIRLTENSLQENARQQQALYHAQHEKNKDPFKRVTSWMRHVDQEGAVMPEAFADASRRQSQADPELQLASTSAIPNVSANEMQLPARSPVPQHSPDPVPQHQQQHHQQQQQQQRLSSAPRLRTSGGNSNNMVSSIHPSQLYTTSNNNNNSINISGVAESTAPGAPLPPLDSTKSLVGATVVSSSSSSARAKKKISEENTQFFLSQCK
eukprot:PhM_4_TR372/c1_g1_i1/m.67959